MWFKPQRVQKKTQVRHKMTKGLKTSSRQESSWRLKLWRTWCWNISATTVLNRNHLVFPLLSLLTELRCSEWRSSFERKTKRPVLVLWTRLDTKKSEPGPTSRFLKPTGSIWAQAAQTGLQIRKKEVSVFIKNVLIWDLWLSSFFYLSQMCKK